ncbi:MAG TPA: extracellular solute-binding protein [Candidatus Binatia bacterium]
MKNFNGAARLLFALLAVFFLGSIERAAAQPASVEAAKKEGAVIVYGTATPQAMDVINKGFEKKYGVRVEYWRASATGVADRALNEWRAGRPGFDVVEASRGVQQIMKKAGLFARYAPPSAEKFPPQFKEKDELGTPWRMLPIGIIYNTELVKAADAPKSLEDLLHPRWKGKLAMPDPSSHTTTAQFLWNLKKFSGDKWPGFVKGLAQQQPLLVESLTPVINALIKGEAHVGIGLINTVTQFKGPVAYAPIERYLADPSLMNFGAKAAHPNAAKLYIDYACSPEGQEAFARTGEFVLSPGVYPAINDADKVAARVVFMDNPSEEEFKTLMADFRGVFFGK